MRCKVGDIAISSSGTLCEILEWVGPNPYDGQLDTWLVRLLSGAMAVAGPLTGKRMPPGSNAYGQDHRLTPLRGDPDAIDEHTEAPTKLKEPA